MSKEERGISYVALKDVIPDANQPRRNFNPERLAELMSSIEQHGIINPLIVEKFKGGYLLVDGERRYRASKELNLKEVPVIVVEPQDETKRLVQQFHLQEQHEGWSAIEKANGVMKLSKKLGISFVEMGRLLAMPERTIRSYMGFADLIEHKEFEKNEIPLAYAQRIVQLRKWVRHIFEMKGIGEFSQEDEAALEKAIISRIKRGDIRKLTDLTKIRDSVKTNPKNIYKFIKELKLSTQKFFLDSDAKSAYHYRNVVNSAGYLVGHGHSLLQLKESEMFVGNEDDIKKLRKAQEIIDDLLGKR